MCFFHNTTPNSAKEILHQKYIYPTTYDYPCYMDRLLDCIESFHSYKDFPDRFLGMKPIPWLGDGIYCFKTLKEAKDYDCTGCVIRIDLCPGNKEFDFDTPEDLMFVANYLRNDFETDLKEKIFDADVINGYLIVRNYLLNFILEDIGNKSKAQSICLSIILFLLKFLKKGSFNPDIISYNFKLPNVVGKYYTIQKFGIIERLVLVK